MRLLASKSASFCVGVAAMASFGSTARGAPKAPNTCPAAYSDYRIAVAAEKENHRREARDSFLSCAQSTCRMMALNCRVRYDRLGAAMPSIIPLVNDENGVPRDDVEVRVDGELVTSRLEGTGLPIEPGLHELSFTMDGKVFETEKVMIVDGQHNRPITVARRSLLGSTKKTAAGAANGAGPETPADPSSPGVASADTPPAETSAADKSSANDSAARSPREVTPKGDGSSKTAGGAWAVPHSPWPYVLGGVGLAAVAAGGVLTYWGNKDNTRLENQCSPRCNPENLDHVRIMYIASDISFGAGLAALGLTTWIFATSRSTETGSSSSATMLTVQPTRSGALASVRGVF